MTAHTVTHPRPTAAAPHAAVPHTPDASVAPGRAAHELHLKPTEFDLAVRLGRIRTVPGDRGGGPRIERAELERLRARPGFPEELRESVRAVGTAEGAALMGVSKDRFTRLARLGLLSPVKYYLNRYRAVVWLYLADEVRQFTADPGNAALLTGRFPEALRGHLDAGLDLRPRNWRHRHLGFLLRQAGDPWARAGAVAALLDPLHVCEVVGDPWERSRVNLCRPDPPAHGAPGSPAADLARELATAQDADEIAWLRADLARLVAEARTHRPAPRPAPRHPGPAARPVPHGPARSPSRLRRLLRRRRRTPAG